MGEILYFWSQSIKNTPLFDKPKIDIRNKIAIGDFFLFFLPFCNTILKVL